MIIFDSTILKNAILVRILFLKAKQQQKKVLSNFAEAQNLHGIFWFFNLLEFCKWCEYIQIKTLCIKSYESKLKYTRVNTSIVQIVVWWSKVTSFHASIYSESILLLPLFLQLSCSNNEIKFQDRSEQILKSIFFCFSSKNMRCLQILS